MLTTAAIIGGAIILWVVVREIRYWLEPLSTEELFNRQRDEHLKTENGEEGR
jgi:hypothetical protein